MPVFLAGVEAVEEGVSSGLRWVLSLLRTVSLLDVWMTGEPPSSMSSPSEAANSASAFARSAAESGRFSPSLKSSARSDMTTDCSGTLTEQ